MGIGEDLITLVVHTEDHASKLKEILESHLIEVTLEDVEIEGLPLQPCPKKVRIPLQSLPLGLKILESGEAGAKPLDLIKMTGLGSSLLIPVDLSSHSMNAVRAGFRLAARFDVEPIILHSFIAPNFTDADFQDPMSLSDGVSDIEMEVLEETDIRKNASVRLMKFRKKVREAQADGELPDIKFSTTLLEGVPEQVILDYCRVNKPLLVVMATRDADKKGSDLVGSVTAEVIDSCRVPVLALPDSFRPNGFESMKNVAMFCTFTGYDTLFTRWLMRSFDYPALRFRLLPAADSIFSGGTARLDRLCDFLGKTYPTAEFNAVHDNTDKFDVRVRKVLENYGIELIIVPNKKSSALSRFFRPTLAHKILFEKDIPLLVLPV